MLIGQKISHLFQNKSYPNHSVIEAMTGKDLSIETQDSGWH